MQRLRKQHFVPYAATDGVEVKVPHEECPAVPNGGRDHKSRLYIKRKDSLIVAHCHHCGLSGVSYVVTRRDGIYQGKIAIGSNPSQHHGGRWDAQVSSLKSPHRRKFSPENFDTLTRNKLTAYLTEEDWDHPMFPFEPVVDEPVMFREVIWRRDKRGYVCSIGTKTRNLATGSRWSEMVPTHEAYGPAVYKCERNQVPGKIVIVEDWLSGVVVGRQADTLVLQGTHLPTSWIIDLCQDYHQAIIWLDDDNPDVKRRSEMMQRRCAVLFKEGAAIIRAPFDPKDADDLLIRESLFKATPGKVVNLNAS